MQQEMTIVRWLFNPFSRIAGTTSLDIAGTQAMARAPLILSVAICSLPWIRNSLAELASSLQDSGVAAPDLGPGVLLGSLIMMAGIAWMIVLMWNAFSACCDIKGGRGIALFVGAVVIGEVITRGAVVRFL